MMTSSSNPTSLNPWGDLTLAACVESTVKGWCRQITVYNCSETTLQTNESVDKILC